MPDNSRSQQNLAKRLDDILRKMKRDGDDIDALAHSVGEEARDLRRWAKGTTLPGHVLIALIDELPRHHADHLIGGTQLRLVNRDRTETTTAMAAVAAASTFTAEVVERLADGEFCHRDAAEAKDIARATVTRLQNFIGE